MTQTGGRENHIMARIQHRHIPDQAAPGPGFCDKKSPALGTVAGLQREVGGSVNAVGPAEA